MCIACCPSSLLSPLPFSPSLIHCCGHVDREARVPISVTRHFERGAACLLGPTQQLLVLFVVTFRIRISRDALVRFPMTKREHWFLQTVLVLNLLIARAATHSDGSSMHALRSSLARTTQDPTTRTNQQWIATCGLAVCRQAVRVGGAKRAVGGPRQEGWSIRAAGVHGR